MSDAAKRINDLSPEKQALLALRLKAKGAKAPQNDAICRRGDQNACPLSFAQQRMWFLNQLEPDSPLYNIPAALHLRGRLDMKALKRSLNEILRRHEVLRATFVPQKGFPVQDIIPELTLDMPLVDLRILPTGEREAEALRLAMQEAQTPFDLAHGPLIRAALLQLGEDEYIALLTIHHIAADGWSIGIFVREITALYAAYSQGLSSPLPELKIQYADYAQWQREWLQGEVLQRQLDYWKGRIQEIPPALDLPTDRPRPPIQTYRGAVTSFDLPQVLIGKLREFNRQEGVTQFITLLAAFQTLLYRYTGLTDICVGTPVANRNRVELEGLIGFFVNTLVLRTDLSIQPTFRELVKRVREVAFEAYAHQDLPFEALVDALKLDRSLGHSPLFQVMFAIEEDPLETLKLPGLEAGLVELDPGTAKFDLTLFIEVRMDVLRGRLEYNTDLFDRETIERMGAHFQVLLAGAITQPDLPVYALPILTEAERRQILVDWTDTWSDYPRESNLAQLFETQVKRSPGAVALLSDEETLSYDDLNQRANRLAHFLQELGVGPEVLVGIFMERSIEMVVATLGIIKAGGAYLPLDLNYPQERLAFMLEDGQVPVLLTSGSLEKELPPHRARVICLDQDWPEILEASGAQGVQNPACRATAESLAYVMYTSGSTGRPKGVCVVQRGVIRLVKGADYLPFTPEDVFLQLAPVSFDAATLEIWGPLLNGGRLAVMPPGAASLGEIGQALERFGVTTLWLTASLFHLMVDNRLEDLRRLRYLLSGGDVLSPAHVRRAVQELEGIQLINGYGPTENTTFSTCYPINGLDLIETCVPIGRPIANTQVYLLDQQLRPVPVGVSGELYLGGDGLARGYLNRQELTAERFIPNPFSEIKRCESGIRRDVSQRSAPDSQFANRQSQFLYRTGDLARWRRDGVLEFLGRIDNQIKLRGFRIELGEIEAVLEGHPLVREVTVVAFEAGPGDKRLAAYIVMGDGGRQDADDRRQTADESEVSARGHPSIAHHLTTAVVQELRNWCRQKLPDYMIPSAFILMEALPVTPNGKVDRRALPAPDADRPDLDRTYVAPRTALEQRLVELWQQVLGVHKIGIHDNFFEIGGDSLRAAVLMNRLQEEMKEKGQVRAVFQAPTVADLAVYLAEHHPLAAARLVDGSPEPAANAHETGWKELRPVPRTGDLQLSFAQERLWFLDLLEPESLAYNVSTAVRLSGPLNAASLERSLNEIVRRHEVLRTTFPTVNGKPSELIAPELAIPIPQADLSHLPEIEREAEARRLALEEGRKAFHLSLGPLIRARLLKLGEDEHIFLLSMHHIVSDGWSIGVFIKEIAALYGAFAINEPSPLPELPIQYADYAGWQREWLRGEVMESQLEYWKRQLAEAPPLLELPTDRPRQAVQSTQGSRVPFSLSPGLCAAIKSLCQQEEATLFMTLLAAFQVLLHRYTGQEDVCVGTPIANRNRMEIENLIGFFVNTLVLRGDLSGEPSFREFLKQVRETALGAFTHQDLPFETLVNELQPVRDLSHTPLFQVMFALQNAPTGFLELPGLRLNRIEIDTNVSPFDLTLEIFEEPGGLNGCWEYNTDLFERATILRMTENLVTLLESIVRDPDQPVGLLQLLPEVERKKILLEWNDTAAKFPEALCVHQLFEAQAQRTPDALAVIEPGEDGLPGRQLTYRELDQHANQLARYLQRLGVGPERVVGISMGRSLELVVALLGTLKAGGAYLPLDPEYPSDRLAFMLEDSRVEVVLARQRLLKMQAGNPMQAAKKVIDLDTDWDEISREAGAQGAQNLESGVGPENLAYVMYTSGSTGRPKGVLVPHRGVVNHNTAVARQFDLQPGDRVLQFATINFDTAVEEIFPTWAAGATLVLRPGDVLLSGEELTHLIDIQRLTVLDLPTPYWQEWVYELSLSGTPLPETLRLVVVGGDKASAESYATWMKVGGSRVRWMNTYGPTEGTVIATWYEAPQDPQVVKLPENIPIGRPLPNVQTYILDRHIQPVPVGVPGELYIGGVGVARGYLNRPELTAERFILDPFTKIRDCGSGIRSSELEQVRIPHAAVSHSQFLYRTGDLARYQPDGNIEFLGRTDSQVKIRGFRVELGEIEAVLEGQPAVREGAVLAVPDEAGRKRLVAYVVPASGHSSPSVVSDVRRFLKEKLPEYMVPAEIILLEAMPRMVNGKLDRRALPAAQERRDRSVSAEAAPGTEEEAILAGIWRQVLGVERLGVHENFFELGGDSILSIQVVARANQAGMRLTPRQIFQHPTIAELALVAGKGPAVRAEQGLVQGEVLLTPIQHWFFEQDLPVPHHWNQAFLLEMNQQLDPDLLEEGVAILTHHHDALRMRFRRREDGPGWEQHIAGVEDEAPFEVIDLSTLPAEQVSPAIEAKSAEIQASLNLESGPLVRVVYFNLGAHVPGRLLLVIHHLVVDGVSWRVLLEDLQEAYRQLASGKEIKLPDKTSSFQQWSARLTEYAQSETVKQELSFWLAQGKPDAPALPIDYPDGEDLERAARSVTVSLSQAETQALLTEVPAIYGVEINHVLLAAILEAFNCWTGQRSLRLELEGHGREDLFEGFDLSRTVGWFTTTFPVLLSLGRARGPGESLKTVKEQLRCMPGHGIGYGVLRYLHKDGQVRGQLAAFPLPQVSFNYLGQFDQVLGGSSFFRQALEQPGPSRSLSGRMSHAISIDGAIHAGRLQMEWTYSRERYRQETITRVAEDFINALRLTIRHCQTAETASYTPSDFPEAGLSQDEIEDLLDEISAEGLSRDKGEIT